MATTEIYTSCPPLSHSVALPIYRNMAGVGQASIAEFGLLEAQPLVRQPARVDPPLARDHLRQVGIAEKGDAARRQCQRLVDRRVDIGEFLPRQPVPPVKNSGRAA